MASRTVQGLLVVLLALFAAPSAHAEKRVALVIGNSAYGHVAPLANPRNDAQAMAKALASIGFEIFGGYDLDRSSFADSLVTFGRAAARADVAVVYYAGHGIQVDGQNYLVPVDAKVEDQSEIDFSLISLAQLNRQLQRGSRINIIFVDACRDNPFAAQLQETAGTRGTASVGRGLRPIAAASNTLVAFATQPDNTAQDGTGEHSPFAAAILRHLLTPGQSLADLMVEVRKDVIDTTDGKQVPWEMSSLTDRFQFVPGAAVSALDPQAAAAELPSQGLVENAVWTMVEHSKDPAVLKKFIENYPNGAHVGAARIRLTNLAQPAYVVPEKAPAAKPRPRPSLRKPGALLTLDAPLVRPRRIPHAEQAPEPLSMPIARSVEPAPVQAPPLVQTRHRC